MLNYLDFTGKCAVVTGGRRGLGREIAIELAACGAKVAVVAQNPDGEEILEALKKTGTPGCYLRCDLAKRKQREGLIERAVKELGHLDILVNNAGFQIKERVEDCSWETWDISMAVMLEAPFDLSKQAIPFLKEQNGGRIIHISSIVALKGGSTELAYAVAKSGLIGMTRSMAQSLGRWNINVNAIAPGVTRSDLTTAQGCFSEENYKKYSASWTMLNRLGEAEDIAAAVLYLASPMGRQVTGQVLVVDGGTTAK